MNDAIDRITENEALYLEDNEILKNEHGVYLFVSPCRKQSIDLKLFLHGYLQYMIDSGKVKEVK